MMAQPWDKLNDGYCHVAISNQWLQAYTYGVA